MHDAGAYSRLGQLSIGKWFAELSRIILRSRKSGHPWSIPGLKECSYVSLRRGSLYSLKQYQAWLLACHYRTGFFITKRTHWSQKQRWTSGKIAADLSRLALINRTAANHHIRQIGMISSSGFIYSAEINGSAHWHVSWARLFSIIRRIYKLQVKCVSAAVRSIRAEISCLSLSTYTFINAGICCKWIGVVY